MTDKESLYREAINRIIDIDLGVYPKSWEGIYNERNDYQNGWNDCLIEYFDEISKIIRGLGLEEFFEI